MLKVVGDGTSSGGGAGVPVAVARLTAASVFLRSAEISRSTPEEHMNTSLRTSGASRTSVRKFEKNRGKISKND